MSERIYKQLVGAGLSHAGACAMLGNFEAESSLKADNLQNSYEKKLGFVDALYTAAVDEGRYKNFAVDGAGYGLAQWTYGPRKKNLLEFANNRGTSIGDEAMQVDFAIHELRTEYPGLFSYLCGTEDVYEATSRICKEFERPAVNNIAARYEFAQKWDKALCGENKEVAQNGVQEKDMGGRWYPPDLSILILQALLVGNNYDTDITGYKNQQFLSTLSSFVKDIGA